MRLDIDSMIDELTENPEIANSINRYIISNTIINIIEIVGTGILLLVVLIFLYKLFKSLL